MFDPKSMANQINPKVKVVPKSGWRKTKRAIGAKINKLFKMFFPLACLEDQKAAKHKIKIGLANSDGCKLNGPRGIHLTDPLVSIPKAKVIISKIKINI